MGTFFMNLPLYCYYCSKSNLFSSFTSSCGWSRSDVVKSLNPRTPFNVEKKMQFSHLTRRISERRSSYVVYHNACLHTCASVIVTPAQTYRIHHQEVTLYEKVPRPFFLHFLSSHAWIDQSTLNGVRGYAKTSISARGTAHAIKRNV